ncbi:hypothetical protein [Cohnella luojiensis]|uniref:Uncharacterized protein n=1 Tax=Cohnella luojiensis TaxID=652876 RepID=A0A4Y8M798_9BACL|nr:hypothetical protein [Cohnella luojiensis]TFE30831.1 hypothetical protein E2980_03375 [Cohnella luojiensis]
MKIKMITLAAGPNGVKQPGKVYEVDEIEASTLVDGGYASYVDSPPEEKKESADNSYDSISGELIGYCSIVPENVGEEHIFGDVLYAFDREEEGKLYFSKPKPEPISLESFTELKADEQKVLLADLQIDGDIGNEEKRIALYAAYLESKAAPAAE